MTLAINSLSTTVDPQLYVPDPDPPLGLTRPNKNGLKDRSMTLFMMYIVSTSYCMLLTTVPYRIWFIWNIAQSALHSNRVGPVPDPKPEPETVPSTDHTSQNTSTSDTWFGSGTAIRVFAYRVPELTYERPHVSPPLDPAFPRQPRSNAAPAKCAADFRQCAPLPLSRRGAKRVPRCESQ